MSTLRPFYVFPFVLFGLLMGLAGGAVRLGAAEWHVTGAAAGHGMLMVGGFMGTLITLERAMVMKNKGWLMVAFLSGASIPAMLLPGWGIFGQYLLLAASIGLVVIMYIQSVKHPVAYQFVISIGAACWFIGNYALIVTGFVPAAVTWWIGFLLFTIVGERLELSKFLPTPPVAKMTLYALLAAFFIGMWLPFHSFGNWLMGGSIVLIGAWLLRYDMARIAAKKSAQFKYIGIGLIVGYLWLVIHGVLLAFFESHPLHYDLYIHTFFLGFAFSMIWAHAPIILPLVWGITDKLYHPILWVGWLVFQLTLIGRVVTSWFSQFEWRTTFGVLNGWTIIAMFALMGLVLLFRRLIPMAKQVESAPNQVDSKKELKNAG